MTADDTLRTTPGTDPDAAGAATNATRGPRTGTIVALGSMTALGPFTIDMHLPALPDIASALDSTPSGAQLTITGTLIGLALGQLVVGPLSDSLGRKRPLVAGIALHIVSPLLAVFATGIAMLGALRVFQGMGAAAAAVVTMAMVRDLFSDKAVAVVISRLMLILGVAPVIAPSVSGARLVALTLVSSVVTASLFAYVSGASFVYQDHFGLDQQQFALVFSAGAFSMIGATQVNVRLLRRWSPLQIVRASLTAALGFGLVAIVFAHFEFGGLAGLVAALWIMLAAICFMLPNAPALALALAVMIGTARRQP
ncbi:MFS transporter [Rhodococcus sp. TAF43]|uniref:MFS transporter n=1 Tax=unclassified Rhodococcus (in: high G+C Gram-positive bacteria) TaxID=192944 RepID=UPI0015831176|nr:MFS transporter [Rhodococcus sp. W8901]QKT11006.1 MFS transporter [Rhodococcus sp. W8901]